MKGIGLVFAGGGGKGAYQIGVWKYLHDNHLDQYVRAVSGTSVGALNAALFVGGNLKDAEELWLNIEPSQILTPKSIKDWLDDTDVLSAGAFIKAFNAHTFSSIADRVTRTAIHSIEDFQVWMNRNKKGLFSREGLITLIHKGVDFLEINKSSVPCYATCLRMPDLLIERFDLRNYTNSEIESLLLASSAIPLIFNSVKFHGREYYDGGIPIVGDNVPIVPIYQTGLENVIVVNLDRETIIDKSLYPNTRMIEITPQNDLGGPVTGTLDFTPEGAKWRIEQGYQDAERVFSPFLEQAVLRKVSEQMLFHAQKQQVQFENECNKKQKKMKEVQNHKNRDGFDELFQKLIAGEEK